MTEGFSMWRSSQIAHLEVWREAHPGEISEEILQFVAGLEKLSFDEFLKNLEKCTDRGFEGLDEVDCPRTLFKLLHIFHEPTRLIIDDEKSLFSYIFKYKGHMFDVMDWRGGVCVEYFILEEGKEEAPEVVKEFVQLMGEFLRKKIPLYYDGRTEDLYV